MKRVTNNKEMLEELKKGNDVWLDERKDSPSVQDASKNNQQDKNGGEP